MKTLPLLLLTLALLAIAIILLGVKVLFVKGGKFPSGHVHDLKRRQKLAKEKADGKKP